MITEDQKVFGLGLSKTGTSSLSEALNHIGIKTIHYPYDEMTYRELREENYRLTLMENWQGAVDISVAPFYAQLDKAFPDSKFILTIRDKEPWLRSCEQHWLLMREWIENFPEIKRFQEFISVVTYGTLEYNRDQFSRAYDRHVEAVQAYFANRPDDFLEMDICNGEGWEKLCAFLGCSIPNIAFPRANEWMHLLIKAQETLKEFVTVDEKVLLIDQQGFGSSFASDYQTVPFLEKEGVYWGIPKDDATAFAELTRVINEGIEYVAIGFPCFWWMTYYPEFAQNLTSRFVCLVENDAIKIFRRSGNDL